MNSCVWPTMRKPTLILANTPVSTSQLRYMNMSGTPAEIGASHPKTVLIFFRYRACSHSIKMVRIVSYFTYYFSNSLGSLGAHFSRVPAPTWVNFPSPVNVELLPLKNGRVFLIWVSKLRTELVLIPSRWYELFPILNIIFQTVWGHSEPISISRVPAPTWALWMDYVSPHTMFAKTFLHFENHLWKNDNFQGVGDK
jgi:hypothetical protein